MVAFQHGARWRRVLAPAAFAAALAAYASAAHAATVAAADISELSLEQLANVIVTSVSRREERLGQAAAAVYVISAEDIRRSGATTIPEALRLAPNLLIARADTNQYAISARGFTNVLANRLLVLIDGRIVYSPLFSGVFWEAQDVMLEDVERIEVISGPGATLWGANAVNGVINVITRSARDTQGALLGAGTGNRERGGTARYGGAVGGGHFRIYGKHFDRRGTERANRTPVIDGAARSQAGFRGDWAHGGRTVTVQGDAYRADIEQPFGGSRDLGGANLLARWSERRADGSTLHVQGYYDRVERDQPGAIRESLDIVDVEAQHGFSPLKDHHLLWGAGYRYAKDEIDNLNPAALGFIPPNHDLKSFHVFAQNEWRLKTDLALTIGVKAEHNDYSGLEWLPSARLAWALSPERLLWSAISRAVRAPARIDRELFAPATPPFALAGGPTFESEISNVVEIGYRAQPRPSLSYSVTAFYHDHSKLRSLEPQPGGAVIANGIEGHTRGLEAWTTWRAMSAWRLDAGWVELRQRLRPSPGSLATPVASGLGNDPKRWVTVRSAFDLTPRHELDVMVRHVAELPNPVVPSYTAFDARFGWHASRELEVSLVAQNLFDRSHPEWGTAATRTELRRGAFLNFLWRQQ
jgi:iron complex outermembrane receptor protein